MSTGRQSANSFVTARMSFLRPKKTCQSQGETIAAPKQTCGFCDTAAWTPIVLFSLFSLSFGFVSQPDELSHDIRLAVPGAAPARTVP